MSYKREIRERITNRAVDEVFVLVDVVVSQRDDYTTRSVGINKFLEVLGPTETFLAVLIVYRTSFSIGLLYNKPIHTNLHGYGMKD